MPEKAQLAAGTKRSPTSRRRKSASDLQRVKVLYRISDLVNSTTNTNTLLRRILRETMETFDADSAGIRFINERTRVLEPGITLFRKSESEKTDSPAHDPPLIAAVVREGKAASAAAPGPASGRRSSAGSQMAAPLLNERRTIGAIIVESSLSAHFSEEDLDLLSAIASQAARVIQTARLHDRLTHQTRRLETLFKIGRQLVTGEPLTAVLSRISTSLLQLIDVSQCTVVLMGEGQDVSIAAPPAMVATAPELEKGSGSARSPFHGQHQTGESLKIVQVSRPETRRPGKMPKKGKASNLLSIPVLFHDRLLAMLNIYSSEPRVFEQEEMRLLQAYAGLAAIAIEASRRDEFLIKTADKAHEADRVAMLNFFTREMASEIRSPLGVVSVLIDCLREDGVLPPGSARDIEIIHRNLNHIDSILSRACSAMPRNPPKLEWLDLQLLAEDALLFHQYAIQRNQIMIQRRFAGDVPRVLIDKSHAMQIINAILSSAVTSMTMGGILTVSTSTNVHEHKESEIPTCRLTIRDTGPGLSSSLPQNADHPFRSTEGQLSSGEVSIFTASRLARQYGGRIGLRNASDHGASVSLVLPAMKGQQQ